jgi:RNA polymerase sigma factor (sigma-70 family)
MLASTPRRSAVAEPLDWLERLKAVDQQVAQQAWTEFLHGYARILLQVISVCERDSENRHECFVYACEQLCRNRFHRLRQFRVGGPASFVTWLRAVVRNLCVDWQRKQIRGIRHTAIPADVGHAPLFSVIDAPPHVSESTDPRNEDCAAGQVRDSSPDPEMMAAKREEILALGSGLRSLTSEQRLALRLRYQQELTFQEIACVLGLKNAQAADRFLHETITLLQQKLNPRLNFHGKTKRASV